MTDSKPTVATPSPGYIEQETWRALPRLLIGGTRELRKEENARVYLPPEDDEEDQVGAATRPAKGGKGNSEWHQRISRSVVVPFFARAAKRAVGAIFAKPVVLAEDVPSPIRGTREDYRDGLWENVDLEGNDGNVFFSRVAEDSLGDAGLSWTLVEHQPVPAGGTRADLSGLGLRAYLVHVKARQVIGDPQYEVVNGQRRLKMIRFEETFEEEGEMEWEPKRGKQIRVLRAGPVAVDTRDEENPRGHVRWEIHRKTDPDDEQSWAIYEQGFMEPQREIPIVPYYTGYLGPGVARTPFDDVAFLNMLHTQKLSDLGEGFRVSLGAQLHRSGITLKEAQEQRAIGAKRLLVSEKAEAKAEWLERAGTAATVALEDLDRLEARMLALSQEPHVRRTGSETATGRAIDAAEAKTETQVWAVGARDHIEQVLMFWAVYLGEETGGSVEVNLPPRVSEEDIEALKLLVDMHVKTNGAPRIQTILEEVVRQGRLPDDLDVEAEAAAVEQSMEPGQEGRMRAMVRLMGERMGMSEEEVDAMLDGGAMPVGGGNGANGNGAGVAA